MPRGDNPNSRANLAKGKPFNADTARKAKEKSTQAKTLYKSINADLKERCTPEKIAALNDRLLSMAEHGNLKAYELVRDGLGEKPVDKVQISEIEQTIIDEVEEMVFEDDDEETGSKVSNE